MWKFARCLGNVDSYSVLERAVGVRVSFVCASVCQGVYESLQI